MTSSLRMLVVEDSPDAADMIATLLEYWGHAVRIAHDGPAALDAAASMRPEVVLLDIGLPGMSGYDVARALRTLGPCTIVAMTGFDGPDEKRLAREAGIDHHLVKPVDLNALSALLLLVQAKEKV